MVLSEKCNESVEGSAVTRERDCGIDLIRVAACCAVVGLHTFSNGLTTFSSISYYFCGFAVPVFFMASGAFLLNRGGVTYSYSIRKIKQLAAVLIRWVLVISFCIGVGGYVFGAEELIAIPKLFLSTFKGTLLQRGLLSHCWFLWSLSFIYILLPTLSRLSMSRKRLIFGVTVSLGLLIHIFSCVVGMPLEALVPQAFRIWIWLEYFLLGGLIYPFCKKGARVWTSGMFLAVSTIVAVGWQLFAGSFLMPETACAAHAEYFYDSVTCVVWCSALFVFVEALRPSRKPWIHLASLTMGIYLFHKLVICFAGCFIPLDDVVWGSGVGFLAVLFSSFVLVGIIKKLIPNVFDLFCRL